MILFAHGFGFFKRQASALLLSFFLMSILIVLAMSVSILVVKDLATVRSTLSGTQSYYAAEGVTELGLLALKQHLPGYEPVSEVRFLNAALATLASVARSDTLVVPCESQGEEWHSLSLNESVQIPLFAETETGVTPTPGFYMDFYVEFYAAQEDGTVVANSIPQRDVLRWKVLGRRGNDMNNPGETEAMSEYIKLYNEEGANSAATPTKFGTADLGGLPAGYQDGKFDSSSGDHFESGYPIHQFLSGHIYNYLVLTNIITENTSNDTLFYRFHSTDYEPVCEYVELAAWGGAEDGLTQQELNTLVKEGESLPVFDFVIYHTDTSDDGESPVSPILPGGLDVDVAAGILLGL